MGDDRKTDCNFVDEILSSTASEVVNVRAFVNHSGLDWGVLFCPQLPDPQGHGGGSASSPAWLVLLLDMSMPQRLLSAAAQGLAEAAAQLPPSTRVLCGTVGRTVSFFDLSSPTPHALVLHSASAGAGASAAAAALPALVRELHLAALPLHECLPHLQAALDSVRHHAAPQTPQRRMHALASGVDIALFLLSTSQAAWEQDVQRHQQPWSPSKAAKQHRPPPNARVVLCSAPPAADSVAGDESQDARAWGQLRELCVVLGVKAAAAGAPLDVMLGAADAAALPCLQAAADASHGGRVLLCPGFEPPFAATAAAAVQRRLGWHGALDVRVPPGVKVARVLGDVWPDLPLPPPHTGGGAHSPGKGGGWSLAAVAVPCIERGQCFGVLLELTRDMAAQQEVEVELLAEWTLVDGRRVRQVGMDWWGGGSRRWGCGMALRAE